MRTTSAPIACALIVSLFATPSLAEGVDPVRDTPASTTAAPGAVAALPAMERELQRQIDRYVTYPVLERHRDMDGDVMVSFVIDAEGRVKVIDAQSRNTALCEYVLRMLAKVDIGDNPDGVWRTTHMRFRFRPEA